MSSLTPKANLVLPINLRCVLSVEDSRGKLTHAHGGHTINSTQEVPSWVWTCNLLAVMRQLYTCQIAKGHFKYDHFTLFYKEMPIKCNGSYCNSVSVVKYGGFVFFFSLHSCRIMKNFSPQHTDTCLTCSYSVTSTGAYWTFAHSTENIHEPRHLHTSVLNSHNSTPQVR